jgi:hypothetical protein
MIPFRNFTLLLVGAVVTILVSTTTPCHAFASSTSPTSNHASNLSRHSISPRTKILLFGGLFGGGQAADGPTTVMDIGAKDVKIGALRFLLQLYLVGIEKPNPWLTQKGEDGELKIYFKDGTAMLSLELQEYGIKAVRFGEKPSLQYMLQESILLHGILDELDKAVFEVENIAEEKRLLLLKDQDAISKAREKLPARKE